MTISSVVSSHAQHTIGMVPFNASWICLCGRCENIASVQAQVGLRLVVRQRFQDTARLSLMGAVRGGVWRHISVTVLRSVRKSLYGN